MPAYKEKFINEITEKDTKIAVSGLIINKEDNLIFLDDGTGVITINMVTDIPINSFVRVFGYLINNGEEMQIEGQIIQDLSKIDKKIYNKLKSLMNQKQ